MKLKSILLILIFFTGLVMSQETRNSRSIKVLDSNLLLSENNLPEKQLEYRISSDNLTGLDEKQKSIVVEEPKEEKNITSFPISNVFILRYSNHPQEYDCYNSASFLNVSYEMYKESKIFQISVSRTHTTYSGEDSGESTEYIIVPRFYYNMKYFGINLGVAFSKVISGEGADLIFPAGGIKMGLLNRAYVYVNLVDASLLALLTYGVTIKFDSWFRKLSFGGYMTEENPDVQSLYAKVRIGFLKNFLFDAQIKYAKISHNVSYNSCYSYFSYLFGVGFMLN